MNSFNLPLSGKHFICPSILNDNFAGESSLGYRSLPFMTLNTSFQPLLVCQVSFEKSADSLMGTPWILSLSLILGNVMMRYVPWCVLPGSNFFGTLSFLDFLEVYFLCQIREVLLYYFVK